MVGLILLGASQEVDPVPVTTMTHPLKYHMSLQSCLTLSMLAFSCMPYLCYSNRKPSGHAAGMMLGGKGKNVDEIRAEEGIATQTSYIN